jgi:hypothetical protein
MASFLIFMKKRGWIFLVIALIAVFLFATSAQAMNSTNYKLDWMVPLSGGGGHASSTNYAIDLTVGQTAVGNASSTNYGAGLGFWTAVWKWIINLPLLFK